MNKYYDSILKKVEELTKENKFLDAINLLEDELEAPYIPDEYIKTFEEKLIETQYNYNYNNPKNPLSKLSKFELMEHINKNNEDCDLAIISYFERFYDEFDDTDFSFIKKIFSDKKFNNSSKIALVQCLKVRAKDLEIEYLNKNTNYFEKINTKDIKLIEENDKLNEIAEHIRELTSNEPSLLDICYASLYSVYEYYFPELPFSNIDPLEVAKKIIYVIKCILESKKPEEDDITKIIYDVLNTF